MNFDSKEAINHLGYNTASSELIIPEYGRHVQNLIEQICLIKDREERNKAARYAVSVMGDMNPHLRDVPDFQHKLWDQLFMISDFKLDVDCPYPIATRESINSKPERLNYPQNHPKYRFYGNNITYMINKALTWEEGEMKDALIMVIANHMKKSYLSWNKDSVKDEVIFEHLYELSEGKINLSKKEEELSTTANLIQVNKKQSNKTNYSNQKSNKKFNKHNNHLTKGKK
ncbi:DUF4290 domain-containing protein [Myroides indicus]|uniref:Uncharacterized protein DUF4290 n=1 Tax=Myroides indicus TaxID=1323422 RepID=A0A4R7EXR7_9FLAO|nr:DUF4290 domain-containing protein [Myroides indicus]TDS53814.1 uncharacterized protein DUF4290 [Myroides indicus]